MVSAQDTTAQTRPQSDRVEASGPVALIPAAGHATRLGSLPCSKEILPVPRAALASFAPMEASAGASAEPEEARRGQQIEPVARGLLRQLANAGIERALVLLRHGKWDIPACLQTGEEGEPSLAYLVLQPTPHVPATLASAQPWVGDSEVVLGFPDILIEPEDALSRLLLHRRTTRADVALAIFPTDQAWKVDTVAREGSRITGLHIKESDSPYNETWMLATWAPSFTRLLARWIRSSEAAQPDRHLGHVLQVALDQGLHISALPMPEGKYLDIGTPGDLRRVWG